MKALKPKTRRKDATASMSKCGRVFVSESSNTSSASAHRHDIDVIPFRLIRKRSAEENETFTQIRQPSYFLMRERGKVALFGYKIKIYIKFFADFLFMSKNFCTFAPKFVRI